MTYEVVLDEQAIDRAAGFLADDPPGVAAVVAAFDRLVHDPHPPDSTDLGGPDHRRLRVGRHRVLYEIVGEQLAVRRIGRVSR